MRTIVTGCTNDLCHSPIYYLSHVSSFQTRTSRRHSGLPDAGVRPDLVCIRFGKSGHFLYLCEVILMTTWSLSNELQKVHCVYVQRDCRVLLLSEWRLDSGAALYMGSGGRSWLSTVVADIRPPLTSSCFYLTTCPLSSRSISHPPLLPLGTLERLNNTIEP